VAVFTISVLEPSAFFIPGLHTDWNYRTWTTFNRHVTPYRVNKTDQLLDSLMMVIMMIMMTAINYIWDRYPQHLIRFQMIHKL